jgi:predicted DNA-binding transcriptional regulator AlpA
MSAKTERHPRLLTWKQLKENIGIPFCREHVRRLEAVGKFPKRIPLSPKKIAWSEDEVLAAVGSRSVRCRCR